MEIDGGRRVLTASGNVVLEADGSRLEAKRVDVLLFRDEAHAFAVTASREGIVWAESDWIGLNWHGAGAPRLFDRLGYLPAALPHPQVAGLPLQ